MNNYIFVYDRAGAGLSDDQMIAFVAENKHVAEWMMVFSGTFIFKSANHPRDLRMSFSRILPHSFYLLSRAEINGTAGAITGEMWNWFNKGHMSQQQIDDVAALREKQRLAKQDELGDR